MNLVGLVSRGWCSSLLLLAWGVLLSGCAGPLGPAGFPNDNDSPPLPDPDLPVDIPLDQVRVVDLEGIHFDPQIEVINTREDLAAIVAEPAAIDIDFETETALWIGWFLPDPCTSRSLVSLSKSLTVDLLVVQYATERDPDTFCIQTIVPFEELLIVQKCEPIARFVVNEELIASSSDE